MDSASILQAHKFHPADYIVFVSALLISLSIGLYYAFTGGRQATVQEYLLGNRQMGILPIAMSLLASFISAISMIGVPAEVYMYGLGGSYILFGAIIALPIVRTCFLPTFYNIGLTSVHEYLELRFDKYVRKMGSFLFLCYAIIFSSFVLYAPALALSQVSEYGINNFPKCGTAFYYKLTGLNIWLSVLTVGVLATIYTSIGGIKAVMWTDVFQIIVMVIAICVIAFKGTSDLGGFSYVFNRAVEGKRLYIPSWNFDFRMRYTVWNVTVGSGINWMLIYATNQIQVQRYLSSPSLQLAKRTLLWNILGLVCFYSLLGICGLNIYGKYWNCDPTVGKLINANDQVFPLFVMETLNKLPGLPGLFVAGIFSGTLSTLSSAFNSMAAITLEDYIRAFNNWTHLSSKKSATVSKILAASYGCLCLLIVVAISQDESNIVQGARYNLGVFNGTLFGIFVLGLFFPWSNRLGAYAGGILGFAFSLWVSVSTQMTKRPFTPRAPYSVDGCQTTYGDSTISLNVTTEVPAYTSLATKQSIYNSSSVPGFSEKRDDVFPLFQIAFMWIPLLAAGSVVIIGAVTSLLTGPTKLECLDLRLLSPVIQNLVKKYLNRKGINTEPSSTEPKGEALRLESRLQTPVFYIVAATENEDRL